MKHSQGPWKACDDIAWMDCTTNRWKMRINNANKGAAAYANAATQEEGTANARLIAAAPDMLETLERALVFVTLRDKERSTVGSRKLWNEITRTIRKATA